MSGSGSQATLQGPGSSPTVSLRDESLARTGVRQVVQCFWKGSGVLGMQLSGRKLPENIAWLDWTMHPALMAYLGRVSALSMAHSCFVL